MFIQFDENGGWEAIAASALRACAFYSSGMETEKKKSGFPFSTATIAPRL